VVLTVGFVVVVVVVVPPKISFTYFLNEVQSGSFALLDICAGHCL
jgi:hypothetical protein